MVVNIEADQAWGNRILFDAKRILFINTWVAFWFLLWDILLLLFENVFKNLAVMHFWEHFVKIMDHVLFVWDLDNFISFDRVVGSANLNGFQVVY